MKEGKGFVALQNFYKVKPHLQASVSRHDCEHISKVQHMLEE
jgi:hypothetical protein